MERREPKVKWELTEEDREFLLVNRIDPEEEDDTPCPKDDDDSA